MSYIEKHLINEWNNTIKYFYNNHVDVPKSELITNAICEDFSMKPIYDTNIEVVNKDSFDLAIEYLNEGLNPAVLNMASDRRPGGGVSSGKRAQEEELFRKSNAHQTHPHHFYPLQTNQLIYSPKVTIIKSKNQNKYHLIEEKNVSMIACAAIRNPKLTNGNYNEMDYNIMLNKIKSIFITGIKKNHDSLVLGALGCGAFHNPPEVVANMFKIAVDLYGKYFKKIGFAVLIVKKSDTNNFDSFFKLLSKNSLKE